MAFSPVEYVMTEHLRDQFQNRVGPANENDLQEMIRRGEVILETENHRYLRSEGLRFPCIRDSEGRYYVKSVITPEMHMEAK